jgi:hypothetical protein
MSDVYAGFEFGEIIAVHDGAITHSYDADSHELLLYLGNKELALFLPENPDDGDTFQTHIENVEGKARLPGATTELYNVGLLVMQAIVDQRQVPIDFDFTTDNPRMIAWARTRGERIFAGWQVFSDTTVEFLATQEICPSGGLPATTKAVV